MEATRGTSVAADLSRTQGAYHTSVSPPLIRPPQAEDMERENTRLREERDQVAAAPTNSCCHDYLNARLCLPGSAIRRRHRRSPQGNASTTTIHGLIRWFQAAEQQIAALHNDHGGVNRDRQHAEQEIEGLRRNNEGMQRELVLSIAPLI